MLVAHDAAVIRLDARGVVVWSADAPFPLDTPLPPDAAELPADAAR